MVVASEDIFALKMSGWEALLKAIDKMIGLPLRDWDNFDATFWKGIGFNG